MNNNTQIETVEEAGKRIYPIQIDDRLQDINEPRRKSFHYGAEWKGQQDEAKYKELLDSHNELLEEIIEVRSDYATMWDADDPKSYTSKIVIRLDNLINKAKELGEALIKANLYVPPKFYGQGESIDNEDYQTIQTTLEKYKNIQYDTQRTNGKHL